jgi:branched-subunit amino acid ABC-type transport system permease component
MLAGTGFAVALYLALYQLHVYDTVWDPWLDSPAVLGLTEPVPDAMAGVLAYGAELILLALGGPERWRTHPYVCLALGAILVCGAVASIALIIVQPTVAGAWCLLCLVSAGLSLALFALGSEEARAAWQHVRRTGQRPAPLALRTRAALRRSVH